MPQLASQQRVENSVAYVERKGDTKAKSNNETRVAAHLSRLATLMERPGVEERVWDSAVAELIIDNDDIPENYWAQQKQIARDNGHGDIELGAHEKNELATQIQEAQKTGLESWRDYLESTGDQYPQWFKFYAWDGMSHLSTFNKQSGHYNKRSNGSVAPYPQLNPAALAKVYDVIENDQPVDDATLAQLIKNGNFNKLYSNMLLEQKVIIPTPENPSDVQGEWKEYSEHDIEAITEAAQGTPWCIAGRGFAERYTEGGGKFILFHLQDPETGTMSPTAAASIRLDSRGNVVELSGLKGGSSQYIEDSLVPTVEERVKGLPGGEKYIEAFEDKQLLIAMDKKFQAGEPFTRDELFFLYEIERPIHYIDTYAKDPRVNEFKREKNHHMHQLAESEGLTVSEAEVFVIPAEDIETNVGEYLRRGLDANMIARKINPLTRVVWYDRLTTAGARIDLLETYGELKPKDKLVHFTKIQEKGVQLDADALAAEFTPSERLERYTALKKIGATLEPNELADMFDDSDKLSYLPGLDRIGAKVDVENLLRENSPRTSVKQNLALYLRQGAHIETLKDHVGISFEYGSRDLDIIARELVHAGLSGDEIMSFISTTKRVGGRTINQGDDAEKRVSVLLAAGVDSSAIARSGVFDNYRIEHNSELLIKSGVDLNDLMTGMGGYYTSRHIQELLAAGADVKDITAHIYEDPKYLLENFKVLNDNGAGLDIDDVIAAMEPKDALYQIALAKELGASVDVNDLLDDPSITHVYIHSIDSLLATGADPAKIADKIKPEDMGYGVSSWSMNARSGYDNSKRYPEISKYVYERYVADKSVAA